MTPSQLFHKAADAGINTAVLKFLHQLVSFGATVLLVRTLSQEGFGIYSILYATIPLLNIVGSLGLPDVLQRFLPEYHAKNELVIANRLFYIVFLLRITIGIIVILGVLLYWDTLSSLIKIQNYKDYFAIFCVCIIAYQQWGMLSIAVEAFFLHKSAFYIQIFVTTGRAIAYLICLLEGYGLAEIVIIDTAAYVFMATSFIVLYWMKVPRADGTRQALGATDRRRLYRYAFFNNFNSIGLRFMDSSINYLIVAFYMAPSQVAIYAFCNQLAGRIARISPVNYLATVIRPAFFGLGINTESERTITMVQFLMKCIVWFYIPVFCLSLLVGEAFIAVIFGKFQDNADIFSACLVVAAINSIGFPVGIAAQLRERVDIILYSKIFGLISLGASILVVPYFGIWGALVAVGVGQLLKNVFIGWFVRDLLPLSVVFGTTLKASVFWGGVTGLTTVVLASREAGVTLMAGAAIFAVSSILFLLTVMDFDRTEKRFLNVLAEKARLQKYVPNRLRA